MNSAPPSRESGWPRTVALCTGDRSIVELPALRDAAEQEPAATHVATADERRREEEAVPEYLEQWLHVPRAGHATEEDEPAARTGEDAERLRVAPEWLQVARLGGFHRDRRVLPQPAEGHPLGRIA